MSLRNEPASGTTLLSVPNMRGLVNRRAGGSQADATSEDALPALRAKRCLFYMYAIVCHSAGELTVADAAALCEAKP